jgi:hypothetical protein
MIGGIDAYPRPDKVKYSAPNFPFADTGCLGNNSRCYMERSLGPLGPGTYPVQVQYRNAWVLAPPDDNQSGAFDWWNLTVQRIDA